MIKLNGIIVVRHGRHSMLPEAAVKMKKGHCVRFAGEEDCTLEKRQLTIEVRSRFDAREHEGLQDACDGDQSHGVC